MARQQPSNGGEGIRSPKVFNTEAEAAAYQQKVAAIEEMLDSMSPADRAEWFALNADADGVVNIDELE